jgi:hypothetical protein
MNLNDWLSTSFKKPFCIDGSSWSYFITRPSARVLKDTASATFGFRSTPVVDPLVNDNAAFGTAFQTSDLFEDFSWQQAGLG